MTWSSAERSYASALVAVFIWALVPVGTRFFVLRIDPIVFNLIRFMASGGAALPLFIRARPWRWPTSDKWLLLGCAALAVPGYNIPVALGARTVPAGELGILIATEPVMIAALALLLQPRSIHRGVIGGSLIALVGVALTSGMLLSPQSFKLASALQVLAGAFSWSCYTVLSRRLNQRYGTFGVTGAILVLGSAALFALSFPKISAAPWPDLTTTAALAAMGLTSSLIGFLLWNYACALVPPERLGLFLYMIPLVSVYAGIQFLGESLTLQISLGGALTLFGVWIASRSRPMVAATAT